MLAAPVGKAAAPRDLRHVAADAGGYHDLQPLRTAANDDRRGAEQPTGGRVLRVGPARDYKKPSEAFAVARDGDTIEIDAGEYVDDAACINGLSRLTVRGVGGRAHMRAAVADGQRRPLQCNAANNGLTRHDGRGTWGFNKVQDVLLENLEFSGAASSSGNSAGIRIVRASGQFTIRNVLLHHNQNGIITSGNKNLSLLVEGSELDRNGRGDGRGLQHNIYVGGIKRFTMRNSYSRRSLGGQLVKSRAFENHIYYNRFTDEAPVNSNYQLELHGLGKAYVIGNVLRKRDGSTNCCTLFHINVERGREHELYVINNTFIYESNPGRADRRFIRLLNPGDLPVKVKVANNLFVGEDNIRLVYTPNEGVEAEMMANLQLPLTTGFFVDMANNDFRLTREASAINGGIDPGSANGVPLAPSMEYVHPTQAAERSVSGPLIDIGAYEFTGTPARLYPLPIVRMSVRNTFTDTSSDLEWSSNADRCVASGGWSGARPTVGSFNTGPIAQPTPFSLTCTGRGGETSETVTAVPPPPVQLALGAEYDPVPAGAGSLIYWKATYAQSCTGESGIDGSQPTTGGVGTGPLTDAATFTLSCLGLNGDRVSKSVTVQVAGRLPALPASYDETFHLAAEPAELSKGLNDGSVVTPRRGPAGVFRVRGKGKAGFEPAVDGHGVWLSYGGGGGQQNKDTAYYEFKLTGAEARALYAEDGGEIKARITPRFDYATRQRAFPRSNGGHQIGHVVSVVAADGSTAALLAFEKWKGGKLHVYMKVPGGPDRTYTASPAASAALLGKDSVLDIRLLWDGSSQYLFLNGALADQHDYERRPVKWGERVTMNVGAFHHSKYGGGWKILHDALDDLRIARVAGVR